MLTVPVFDAVTTGGVVPDPKRRRQLLRQYSHLLPNSAFVRLFGISESAVRNMRRAVKTKRPTMREDRFARTKELPKCASLDDDEWLSVKAYWEDLRADYARNDRVRRMRDVIRRFTGQLPTAVIGRIFGVTAGAVLGHQRDLDLTLPSGRSNQLLRTFVACGQAPWLRGLTAEENSRVADAWAELRAQTGADTRVRQDYLLRIAQSRLPTVVYMRLFTLTRSAVCARRRDLELPPIDDRAILKRFLTADSPPTVPQLDTAEQRVVREVWNGERARTLQVRTARFAQRTQALMSRLRLRAAALSKAVKGSNRSKGLGLVLVHCANKHCRLRWPRTPEFFDRSQSAPDGLHSDCKVCEYRRKTARLLQGKKREAGRILTTRERKHLLAVLRANDIPNRFLYPLFSVTVGHISPLRRACDRQVTVSDSWHLYLRWMAADEMPAVTVLTREEMERLAAIWEEEKRAFESSLAEDDGRYGLQREQRTQLAGQGRIGKTLVCHGPYCEGREAWPRRKSFLRTLDAHGPAFVRCLACANREKREKKVEALRQAMRCEPPKRRLRCG